MPTPKPQEFRLKRPDGSEVVLMIPPKMHEARNAFSPEEEQRICGSMSAGYRLLSKRGNRALTMLEKKRRQFEGILRAPLLPAIQGTELELRHLDFNWDGRNFEELMKDLNRRRSDPKLGAGVLKLALDSGEILFEHKNHRLMEMAVAQALRARDEEFFLKLGGAFARARKARKGGPSRKSLSLVPQGPKNLPLVEFLLDWWQTEDGLGPQLCLFTDQAIGELLEVVFIGSHSDD